MSEKQTERLVHLDPAVILATDNIRFQLSPADVAQMVEDITKIGYVTTTVEVEDLPQNAPEREQGFMFRLTTGFRRHAGVSELNKTGAGLTLPAIVRNTNGDGALRLKHQLSENIDRKNLSSMDQAVAIKRLFDAGLSKGAVRDIFRRPTSSKGTETRPASNSWINMMLGFLELPKSIQADIHAGLIGVKAGYQITKCSPDKRQAIVDAAKDKRKAEIDAEEAEEKKYLEAEKKVNELAKAEVKVTTDLDLAQAEADIASVDLRVKSDLATAAYTAAKGAKGDKKKAAEEKHKAAETDFKGAQQRHEKAVKELTKLTDSKEALSTKVQEMRDRLTEARKAAPKKAGKGKGAGPDQADIKKAAKEAGDSDENVKLNGPEMRKAIEELTLAGTYATVSAIGAIIKDCFDGKITSGQMLKKLATLTGEYKAPAPKPAKK